MKMTKNRLLILEILKYSDLEEPPHSASTIEYLLESAFNFKWTGEPYESMKAKPSIQQIHRTLRDLWHGGLIIGMRVKEEPLSSSDYGLPRWVIKYQTI